jgi:hypothetical protein
LVSRDPIYLETREPISPQSAPCSHWR